MDEFFNFNEGTHLGADSFFSPGQLSNVALTASPKGGTFVGNVYRKLYPNADISTGRAAFRRGYLALASRAILASTGALSRGDEDGRVGAVMYRGVVGRAFEISLNGVFVLFVRSVPRTLAKGFY